MKQKNPEKNWRWLYLPISKKSRACEGTYAARIPEGRWGRRAKGVIGKSTIVHFPLNRGIYTTLRAVGHSETNTVGSGTGGGRRYKR